MSRYRKVTCDLSSKRFIFAGAKDLPLIGIGNKAEPFTSRLDAAIRCVSNWCRKVNNVNNSCSQKRNREGGVGQRARERQGYSLDAPPAGGHGARRSGRADADLRPTDLGSKMDWVILIERTADIDSKTAWFTASVMEILIAQEGLEGLRRVHVYGKGNAYRREWELDMLVSELHMCCRRFS